ncbi:MAG: type VI secretion system tube protein Hcp [Acidimicrobiales bacterium]
MAITAYCYFPGTKLSGGLVEEKKMKEAGAFVVRDYEIGAENSINIGSISAGGGAGKATFKELTVTKTVDGLSCDLFSKLTTGGHYNDMIIELHKAAGSGSTEPFVKWEFKLVMVQDIAWTGSEYDDETYETVVLQYGAMKTTYFVGAKKGKMKKDSSAEWSRILNSAQLAVE